MYLNYDLLCLIFEFLSNASKVKFGSISKLCQNIFYNKYDYNSVFLYYFCRNNKERELNKILKNQEIFKKDKNVDKQLLIYLSRVSEKNLFKIIYEESLKDTIIGESIKLNDSDHEILCIILIHRKETNMLSSCLSSKRTKKNKLYKHLIVYKEFNHLTKHRLEKLCYIFGTELYYLSNKELLEIFLDSEYGRKQEKDMANLARYNLTTSINKLDLDKICKYDMNILFYVSFIYNIYENIVSLFEENDTLLINEDLIFTSIMQENKTILEYLLSKDKYHNLVRIYMKRTLENKKITFYNSCLKYFSDKMNIKFKLREGKYLYF